MNDENPARWIELQNQGRRLEAYKIVCIKLRKNIPKGIPDACFEMFHGKQYNKVSVTTDEPGSQR